MKKIILIVLGFFLVINFSFADRLVIVEKARSKGVIFEGFSLYDEVKETHEDTGLFGWGSGKSTLKCYGQRDIPCVFSNMPESLVASDSDLGVDDLRTHAENQIAINILTGTFTDQLIVEGQGTFNRTVEWEATSSVEALITITVEKVN